MSNENGAALPLPQRIWQIQVLWYKLLRLVGVGIASETPRVVAATLAWCLGAFMVAYPITVFAAYIRSGVVLVAPNLALTFLGGFVGIGLARSGMREHR
jgi:hypothetical protein